VQKLWSKRPWKAKRITEDGNPLQRAAATLRGLLDQSKLPPDVRESLSEEFSQVERMMEKLDHGTLHVAVFGRVGVGKSALLNALLGKSVFSVSPLHGATRSSRDASLTTGTQSRIGHVVVIDTPGIDEIDGAERERIAYQVVGRADLVLFVVDADLSAIEHDALQLLAGQSRPLMLILNKADRYSDSECAQLQSRLVEHASELVAKQFVVTASADPDPVHVRTRHEDGTQDMGREKPPPDIAHLRQCLWKILEREGHTLLAMNAALFAGELSDQVATQIVVARRDSSERLIRLYAAGKALTVGANPIPVADLLCAATLDIGLVVQLSRIYGLPLGWRESGKLVATISTQLAALMGAVWGVNLVSSALKFTSLGMSTVLTGSAQAILAWYATYLVGRAAEAWLLHGCTWGGENPKKVIKTVLDSIDRRSVLQEAREDILRRIRTPT